MRTILTGPLRWLRVVIYIRITLTNQRYTSTCASPLSISLLGTSTALVD
jgi:hypothetical protein